MVLGKSPDNELEYRPNPVPLVVILGVEMVGFGLVLQQIPLDVIEVNPLSMMFPPESPAVPATVKDIDDVRTTGTVVGVLVIKLLSLPYPVPEVLVAYART